MRRVKPAQLVRAERDKFAVADGARRAVRHVADRDDRRDLAAERRGLGGNCEELVERATLVRLVMRKRDVPELLDGHHRRDRLAHQWEETARTCMEQQRLVVVVEELAEGESAGNHRHRRADAVDAVAISSRDVPESRLVIMGLATVYEVSI